MSNQEGIEIHTMHDDLVKARPSVSISTTNKKPTKPTNQPKLFPIPPSPNSGNLSLPIKPSPARLKSIRWPIISAAVLIVLNIIIWGIAILG